MDNVEIISDILYSYEIEHEIWWEKGPYPVGEEHLSPKRIICIIKNIDKNLIKDFNESINNLDRTWISQCLPVSFSIQPHFHEFWGTVLATSRLGTRNYTCSKDLLSTMMNIGFIKRIKFLTNTHLIKLVQARSFSRIISLELFPESFDLELEFSE